MSDRREYSPEEKAAVMAALLAGQSVSQAAATYRIPRGTIAAWSGEVRRMQTDPNTKKDIGDLLVRYLESNLQALTAQMEVFSDRKWLEKQSASEVGVLHGILADKAIRLLEALADREQE